MNLLSDDQIQVLFERAKQEHDWFYTFLVVALNTGMRRGEIINLQWDNVDFQRQQIEVVNRQNFTTKSGKIRYIPMNDFLASVLFRPSPAHKKYICLYFGISKQTPRPPLAN